eukprot:SAG25_NODE_3335_length_1124_cov_2.544390_1_plen_229_part_01
MPPTSSSASPLMILALAYGAALAAPAWGLAGDCTAIEVSSYAIVPGKFRITRQASCEPNNCHQACQGNPSMGYPFPPACLDACHQVYIPSAAATTRNSPVQKAAGDACRNVPCHAVIGVNNADCHVRPSPECQQYTGPCDTQRATGIVELDQTMLATKVAAMALSSPKCARCAAQYAIDPQRNCTRDYDCVHCTSPGCHPNGIRSQCAINHEDDMGPLLAEHKYAEVAG